MPRRHLATENDRENIICLIKPYKKPNKRSYLVKFLTSVMVVINYLTTMSVIVVICYINCDLFYFLRALINITKDNGQSLFITMPLIHQMALLYFA